MLVEIVFLNASAVERVLLHAPMVLEPFSQTPLRREDPHANGIFVVPVDASVGIVAAALIAAPFHGRLAVNGCPVHAGVSVLRHTDYLDYAGQRWWVCAESSAEQVPYDPKVHGDDVFCLFTKARIAAGDLIVCCPGKPGVECRAVYKATSWNLAMQSEKPVGCLNCGYKPPSSRWEPPSAKEKKRSQIDALIQRVKSK